jgi:unsaturated rhamnogalacturonyl hydrolase
MRSFVFCLLILSALLSCDQKRIDGRAKPIILYDQYHHQKQDDKSIHASGWYGVADTSDSGYSRLFDALSPNYEIRETEEKITRSALQDIALLIIVNPDLPKHAPQPNYVAAEEIDAITDFVKTGGGLLVIGNSSGEVELDHLNVLLGQFGFTFNDDETGMIDVPMTGNKFIFGLTSFAFWDGCTIAIAPSADAIKVTPIIGIDAPEERAIAVLSEYGEGRVIAVGDAGSFLNEATKTLTDNLELFVQLVDLLNALSSES